MRTAKPMSQSIGKTAGLPPSDEDMLHEIVQHFKDALKPERIYFFGSRARGDHRPNSDYDLMIIVADETTDEEFSEHWKVARSAFLGTRVHTDVKVWRRTFFDRQLHLKASMPSSIVREGRLVYVQDGYEFDNSSGLAKGGLVREGHDPVLVHNTRDWLSKAGKDIRGGEIELASGDDLLEDVMFHSQQAVEKALKAYLTWHDTGFPKTHELNELGELCMEFDPAMKALVSSVLWLSQWSWVGRYPCDVEPPTRKMAEGAFEQARSFVSEICKRMPPEVSP